MRILLAVDGSRSADRARDLVAALPWREGGQVRIVSVAPTRHEILGVPWSLARRPTPTRPRTRSIRVHRDALDDGRARDPLCPVATSSSSRSSSVVGPARSSSTRLARWSADLIVVGHRGHGPLGVDAPRVRIGRGRRPRAVPRPRRPRRSARADRAGRRRLLPRPDRRVRGPRVAALQRAAGHRRDASPRTASRARGAIAPMLYADTMTGYTVAIVGGRARARRLTECEAAAKRLRDGGFDAIAEVREGDAGPPDHRQCPRARRRDHRGRDPRPDAAAPARPRQRRAERPAPRPVLGPRRSRGSATQRRPHRATARGARDGRRVRLIPLPADRPDGAPRGSHPGMTFSWRYAERSGMLRA